ncbi:glutathione S-transferase family protein [Agrobacterium vaccinii]|nr:glutathione S-transferase family protein [Agrobacterium vaccinii]
MVRWMLEEVGADYDTIVLDYQKASADDQWGGAALEKPTSDDKSEQARFFGEVNPIGKIPAIEHDGRVISESGAIIAYLADIFPLANLSPGNDEKADYYRWMFFAAGPVEQAVTNKRAGFVPLPEQEFFFGHGSYERTLDQLEFAVTRHPFIAGERFTAADVYVGSHIGWGLGLGTIPPREAFVKYAGNLVSRAAYKRSVELDNALLQEI